MTASTRTQEAPGTLGFALSLCSISGVMSALVLVPIMPELFRTFGALPNATFWLPALLTIPGLCCALLSPLAGYIGDKIGLKWPIVCFLVFYALFGSAPFYLNDFAAIFATRVGLGICQVGVLVLSIAMIGHEFEGQARDRWLAFQAAAATTSSIVLLPLSGFLAGSAGWHGSFLVFLLAGGLALFIALQPSRTKAVSTAAHGEDSVPMPWMWLLRQCLVTCVSGLFFFSAQFQLGLALATVGVKDAQTIGLLSALAAVGVVAGSLLFLPVKQRLGSALLPLDLLVNGLTLLAMWKFQTIPALVGFAFVNMVACGMLLPALVTTVAAGLPDATRGRGLGLWNSAFVLAQFLSSALVSVVLAHPGATVLDAFGLLGVLALALAATVASSERSSSRA